MNLYKKFQLLTILLSLFLFSACVKKLDGDGLTLQIQESQLNDFSQEFPIRQNFIFANIELLKPHLFVNENKLKANLNLNFSAIFVPKTEGTFVLSGVPYFDKEKSAIFLKDIQMEDLNISNLNIDKNIVNNIAQNTKPIIDDIFNKTPIYKLDKSSFKGSFVKDVKIENSELLVTFGF